MIGGKELGHSYKLDSDNKYIQRTTSIIIVTESVVHTQDVQPELESYDGNIGKWP